MKINYQLEMEKEIAKLRGRESLLLHSCCGPCSTAVLESLAPYFDVTVFFYNPNIRPCKEFEKRLHYQKKVIECMPGDIGLIACDWSGGEFDAAAVGLEEEPEGGARCMACFNLRLSKTAEKAAEMGFDRFCTALTVSPHKDAQRINMIGRAQGERLGVRWLPSDFKKKEGYKRSIELSNEMEIYRQAYCGCGLPGNAL